MKKCPACNATYSPGISFCPSDGTALLESPDPRVGNPGINANGVSKPPFVPAQPAPRTSTLVTVVIVVVVGLVGIAIVSILMLIAIPTVGSLRRNANRISAIQSIRAVQQAEMQYAVTYPANGYACSLQALGGDASSGPPSPQAAQLLQGDIVSGHKSGYVISIGNCQKVTVKGTDRIISYAVTAVPETVGKTGGPGFCADDGGTIRSDPSGGTNCTELLK